MADDNRNISPHILPSSANLLGVCFLIFSLVSALHKNKETFLDEFAILGIFIFLAASILSYLSLRSRKRKQMLERYADYVFIFGLLFLTVACTIVAVDVSF